jgi:exoribonuclease-2
LGRGEYALVRNAQDGIGHFGLGMNNYAHSTAPNRRFPDLVTQRIVLARLCDAGAPYTVEELEEIAAHCTEREGAAQKVERLMRKVAAAALVGNRIGEVFHAVVTGASDKGVYVRAESPVIEGRVTRGERGLDIGDTIRVRLLRADVEHGHIDFERV